MPTTSLFLAVSALQAQTVLVQPYVQPGNGSTLKGSDVKVIRWLTDAQPGQFVLEYRLSGNSAWKRTGTTCSELKFGLPNAKKPAPSAGAIPTDLEEFKQAIAASSAVKVPDREQHLLRYHAEVDGLPFDSTVEYRVSLPERVVRESAFKTRASAGKPVRFVAMGDMATGAAAQNRIAYQISLQTPDFLVALGDIVYPTGRVSQYLNHYWPTYSNATEPSMEAGAPLMASIPFYPVLGNHDVDTRLSDYPDALAAFHFFNVPRNGPGTGPWLPKVPAESPAGAHFLASAGNQYPAMLHYSFDYGAAHFVVLDCNGAIKPEDQAFMRWLEKDLGGTRQPWKFVAFHAPGFHTSREHYTAQKMRLFQPCFEKHKVDVVFAGHVHNYQRSKPLRFSPKGINPRNGVSGDFQLDETFDGIKDTTPEGVIHVVSGGGGAKLYSVDYEKTVTALKAEHGENYVPFTSKYYATKHSFSLIELDARKFTLRQINADGEEVDCFTITK
jgi:predicted phosphodiesterase